MAKKIIEINVNGLVRELAVEPWNSLAETLRDQLGLMGTKIGCNGGSCGCCTILLDGKPVSSCLLLAVEADKREVITAEGLAAAGPLAKPLLEALAAAGVAADPFAAAGLALAAHGALKAGKTAEAVAGNVLCAVGYDQALAAVDQVAAAPGKEER